MSRTRRGPLRTDGGRPRSKVARVIETYGLADLSDELEARWLAEDDSGMSLRELADYFNKRVLEAAIERSEINLLDVDVDTIYEQLTDEETSSGVRTRTRRRLDRNGVDVDAVTSDFVTHQSMHTYLRKYREVQQPSKSPEERREAARERIQKLQDRTAAVTEDTLTTLQREGLVDEGAIDVFVDIQVVWSESGEQHGVFDLLRE
ncbi:MAG: rod-determining factor RdfA [Halapricum sp.]